MKSKIIILTLLLTIMFVGCETNDYEAPDSFSDVGWYHSDMDSQDSILKVSANKYLTFMDLSQGTTFHEWTIEDGDNFLKGPIKNTDTIFNQYIIKQGETVSNEKTINVLFNKGGLRKVRLFNKFNKHVEFKGFTSWRENFTVPSERVGDAYVIDTTFIVDVYDTIVPIIKVEYKGIVLNHLLETDIIEVEAGDKIKLTSLTKIGRPDTFKWSIGSDYAEGEEVELTLKKLGTFSGAFEVSRSQDPKIPGDSEWYKIPASFKVIPSSQPFIQIGDIIEQEDETIQVSFNGEFAPFADQRSHFMVKVNGVPFNIESISINNNDSTILDIKLQAPIYRPDIIIVSYNGAGSLKSTDDRSPVSFTDIPVVMHDVNLWDDTIYGFEDGPDGSWVSTDDPLVEYSTDQAASGNYSLKLTNTLGTGWTRAESINNPINIPAGIYTITFKVFKAASSVSPDFGPHFHYENDKAKQFWQSTGDKPVGDWVTVEREWETSSDGNAWFSIRINAGGVIYLDDVRIVKKEERP